MAPLRAIILFVLVSIAALLPVVMIVAGIVIPISWWWSTMLVCGGMLLAWLIKPLSILLERDLKII